VSALKGLRMRQLDNDRVNNPIMERRGSRGANGILAAIAILIVALIATSILISTNQQDRQYSTTTPEGVVQTYLKAVIEGKHDQAASFFVAESECDAADIDRAYVSDSLRVNLVSSEIEGDSAYVKIDANMNSGALLDDGYTESHTYRLKRESGSWRLEGIPWPVWDCGEGDK